MNKMKLEEILNKPVSERDVDENIMVSYFLKVNCFVENDNIQGFNNMYQKINREYGINFTRYMRGVQDISEYTRNKWK